MRSTSEKGGAVKKHMSRVALAFVFLFLGVFTVLVFTDKESDPIKKVAELEEISLKHVTQKVEAGKDTHYDPSLFKRVFALIEKDYLYDVDLEKCQYDILKALSGRSLSSDSLQARNTEKDEFVCLDKFSGFKTPDETRASLQHYSGAYSGIGIYITEKDDAARVLYMFKKSPAKEAGMLVGDTLLRVREIGSDMFTDINARNAVNLLIGKTGSEIVIVVERNGKEVTLPSIKRALIELQSVYSLTLPGEIGYIQVRSWNDRTGVEMEAALAPFEGEESPRVIIDVRNNPGGRLWSVLEALFYFDKNPNTIVFTERFKKGEDVRTIGYLAANCANPETGELHPCFISPKTGQFKTPGRFAHYRVIVLTNNASASASEVFAGTIKDWGSVRQNFIVLGEKTYGKGVVQLVTRLGESKYSPSLTLTNSEYFVGNSKNAVHGVGVIPNIAVSDLRNKPDDTATTSDTQFRAALYVWDALKIAGMTEFLSRKHFDERGDIIE